MELFEAMWTTRAMRRLDPDRPVPEADLWKIVEAASKAPSGGNRQVARWLVVTDPERRAQLGVIYGEAWRSIRPGRVEEHGEDAPIIGSADHLADHMGEAPAIVIPCSNIDEPSSIF